ncbi:RNA polymerase sigma-54 factor 2 [Iodidimonas gelatinilytica]|uniref:RNA polymerase sigma-54 factor n=1 Tax=Iodidimonas gelatinilytica TaxID=1236966 RepID=A0A5A7N3P2_9PROT|nr:RNA polymerase factor sigma-54 [Iodidimonas gelatinilytica]GER01990.1 RNA polymerase sigma-54 factor 2 [Iodidimonas gelatinilytica]
MALSPRLDLRQSQQLVLTPQLQQAIKLLQMANLELSGFIEQEMERNPLLELGEGDKGGSDEPGGDAADMGAAELSGFDLESGVYGADAGMDGSGVVGAQDAPLDADFSVNVFDDGPNDGIAQAAGGSGQLGLSGGSSGGNGRLGGNSDEEGFEQNLSDVPDLRTHLNREMQLLIHDVADRMIASNLIDLVDEAGYLSADLSDMPERLGVEPQDVERVLVLLKGMEPTGVFARDLAECLALQLKEKDRFDPCMAKLVENLHLLGRRDLAALKRVCGVDDEDLAQMIGEIRALDPKPGLAFGSEETQTVVPDVFVRRSPEGGWTVELNSETLPRVLVNQHYFSALSSRASGKDDKQFLSDCLSNANWLVKALDQRARTILKVSTEIVRQQEGFFTHGVRHLRPLTLRDIADTIEIHESTVSRVTSAKFMATNRGVFELKYFFTSAIQSSEGGDSHSSESVRDTIRALINAEDPKKILSDDRIVELLKAEGIDIARRTVAKYREAMRIPSSVQRRREKRMSA